MKRNHAAALHHLFAQHIPLKTAVLCLDCDCVSSANQRCPACSSGALLNLSTVLDPSRRIQLPSASLIPLCQ